MSTRLRRLAYCFVPKKVSKQQNERQQMAAHAPGASSILVGPQADTKLVDGATQYLPDTKSSVPVIVIPELIAEEDDEAIRAGHRNCDPTSSVVAQREEASSKVVENVAVTVANPRNLLGITLKRLGLRMYIVCCTNNIIAQGSSGGKDNPRFGDEVVGVDGQSIGLMTAAAVEALIEHAIHKTGQCMLSLCRQPLVQLIHIGPHPFRSYFGDVVCDGFVVTAVNGRCTIGASHDRIAHLMRPGGVVEVIDSMIYEALIRDTHLITAAPEAWKCKSAQYDAHISDPTGSA